MSIVVGLGNGMVFELGDQPAVDGITLRPIMLGRMQVVESHPNYIKPSVHLTREALQGLLEYFDNPEHRIEIGIPPARTRLTW